jgi:hypothetical protein
VTPEEFDAYFDRFTSTVFRLETLQDCGDPRIREKICVA